MKIKYLILAVLIHGIGKCSALAGLPPTTTRGNSDPTPVTTFNIYAPNIPITHSGTTATIGTIPTAGGGTGQTTYTKGDLLASPGTTLNKLSVGSNGQVLTADSAQTNGVKWDTPTTALTAYQDSLNLGCSVSVAANALTVAVKNQAGSDPSSGDPTKVSFRSATLTSGGFTQVSITSALSMTVSSGSTLGTANSVEAVLNVYLINNSGTAELAIINGVLNEAEVVSTTAEGGAGAADSANVAYSTTARSSVPAKLICKIRITEATAGTWASAPTMVSPISLQYISGTQVCMSTGTCVIATAKIGDNGSACVVSSSSGPWLTGGTRAGTGDCSFTIATGTFSSAPTCVISANDASVLTRIVSSRVFNISTTNVSVGTSSIVSGSSTIAGYSGNQELICVGPK